LRGGNLGGGRPKDDGRFWFLATADTLKSLNHAIEKGAAPEELPLTKGGQIRADTAFPFGCCPLGDSQEGTTYFKRRSR
jgi:hypothetical protein